jgi:hypothetical protein
MSRIPLGILDMSSDQPHVNNECPFCGHVWMDKVKPSGECLKCGHAYAMKEMPDGAISISWTATAEEVAIFKARTGRSTS